MGTTMRHIDASFRSDYASSTSLERDPQRSEKSLAY